MIRFPVIGEPLLGGLEDDSITGYIEAPSPWNHHTTIVAFWVP